MKIKTRNEIGGKAIKYHNLYSLIYEKKMLIYYIVVSLIALATGGFFLYRGIKEPKAITHWLLMAISFILSGYLILLLFQFEKTQDKYILEHLRRMGGPTETFTTLDEEKIVFEVPAQEYTQETSWSDVVKIVKLPEYYFIYFKTSEKILIDRSLEAILEGSASELDELITNKVNEIKEEILKTKAQNKEKAPAGEKKVKVQVRKFVFHEITRSIAKYPPIEYSPEVVITGSDDEKSAEEAKEVKAEEAKNEENKEVKTEDKEKPKSEDKDAGNKN